MRVRSLILVVLFLSLQAGSSAHEVPNQVTVLAFLKPEGQTLQFLVRAPMASLRDISVPIFGDGYLQISSAEPALRDAATLWISRLRPALRKRAGAAQADGPSGPRRAAVKQGVCQLRPGHRQRPRPAAAGRHQPVLGAGRARRAVRIPHRLGSIAVRDSPGLHPPRPAGERRPPLPLARPRRSASSTSTPTSASSNWIRAGTRRRGCSSRKASGTSWTAPITCCSCCAWWCRSGGCGRCWWWSPPSPWRTRSR